MRRTRFPSRAISALLLAYYLPACTKWGAPPQTGVTPAQAIAAKPGQHVRLTVGDGRLFELRDSRLAGDSVVGIGADQHGQEYRSPLVGPQPSTDRSASAVSGSGDTSAVALSEISKVEVRRGNPWGTVGLAVLGAGVAFGIIAAVAMGTTCMGLSC